MKYFISLLIVLGIAAQSQAAFETAVVPFVITTASSGTLDVQEFGFGTPTGAIVVLSGQTSDDVTGERADAFISIGFFDGTNECVVSGYANGQGETNSKTQSYASNANNYIAVGLDDDSAWASKQGHLTASWATNGITLTYGESFEQAYRGYVVLIKGTDDIDVGEVALDESETPVAATTGSQSDVVLFLAAGALNDGHQSDLHLSLGAAVRETGEEMCLSTYARHNQSLVANAAYFSTGKSGWLLANTGTEGGFDLTTWSATDGFTLTLYDDDTLDDDMHVYYLAINLPSDASADMGWVVAPTSGTQTISPDYAAASELLLVTASKLTSANTLFESGHAGIHGFGASDSALNQSVAFIRDDDGETVSEAASTYSGSHVVATKNVDAGRKAEGATTDMDASGTIEIDYDNFETGTNYWWWLSIENTAAPAAPSVTPILFPAF